MLFSLLLYFVCIGIGQAQVKPNDIFTIARVPVDASAETATLARGKAVAEGQRRAVDRLFKQISTRADWPRLPVVSATTLESLVLGFEVADERTTATKYMAKLTVAFRADRIRSILKDAGVSFTETKAAPALIIPVFNQNNQVDIWGDENPWRAAWSQLSTEASLLPIIIPAGGQKEMQALPIEEASNPTFEGLRSLIMQYNTQVVMIAYAKTTDRSVEVSIVRWSLGQDKAQQIFAQEYVGGASPEMLTRVALDSYSKLEDDWKHQTLLRFDVQNEILVQVSFNDLGQWINLRRLLSQTAEIRMMQITSLTNHEAVLWLKYLGEPTQLRTVFLQHRLQLFETAGAWQLKLGDTFVSPKQIEEKRQP